MPSEKVLLEKQQAVADLKAKLEKAVSGVLVDYKGINVASDTKLRKELREAGVDYSVYKNSVIRFAVEGTPYADLAKHLEGTTAFALSEEDAVAPARIVAKYSKDVKDGFNLKAGFVEGKMLDAAGNGIEAVAAAPFSASALHYTIESLDEGWSKRQGHSQEVEEADLTNFCIDKVQAGLGCEDSWGRIARPEYQVPYADYEFTFILTPVHHNIGIQ